MILIVPLILVLLVGLAVRFGSDSRDGRDWASSVTQRCTGNIVTR